MTQKFMPSVRRSRANVMGVAIDAVTFAEAVNLLESFVASGAPHCVCVNSAQDIVIAQDDPEFRAIVNGADLATADGWPVVWHVRRQGFDQRHRVTGPDLMWALCGRSVETGHRHFFYGGAPSVPAALCDRLRASFPGIHIAGAHSPPFRPLTEEEEYETIAMIEASAADFLWVGLSTPKQHFWMRDFRERLRVPVMATVGAAFDFHSGRVPRAPRWMQDHALEWLHRATREPRRLGGRYLRYLPRFFALQLAQRLNLKRFEINACKRKFGPVARHDGP